MICSKEPHWRWDFEESYSYELEDGEEEEVKEKVIEKLKTEYYDYNEEISIKMCCCNFDEEVEITVEINEYLSKDEYLKIMKEEE